jgi:cytochrome bd ubiquinol oxidase subunit I
MPCAVLLSRMQFAFVVSFHIIFPAFTIGLAAWLATMEGVRLVTGNPVYRRVFDFWLKVFALSLPHLLRCERNAT